MPHETEPFVKDGQPYHAYLAEMRSIGGLSGSPVYVFIDRNRLGSAPDIPEGRDFVIFCLGLIQGHWDLQRDLSDNVDMHVLKTLA